MKQAVEDLKQALHDYGAVTREEVKEPALRLLETLEVQNKQLREINDEVEGLLEYIAMLTRQA